MTENPRNLQPYLEYKLNSPHKPTQHMQPASLRASLKVHEADVLIFHWWMICASGFDVCSLWNTWGGNFVPSPSRSALKEEFKNSPTEMETSSLKPYWRFLNYLFSLDLGALRGSSAEYLSKWSSVVIQFPVVQKSSAFVCRHFSNSCSPLFCFFHAVVC